MSLIVIAWTEEGFILGADGKATIENDEPRYCDQKIFPSGINSIAYSLYGVTGFPPEANFIDICKKADSGMSNKSLPTYRDYGKGLSLDLRNHIADEKKKDRNLRFYNNVQAAHGSLITQIASAGYFNGQPFLQISEISHLNNVVNETCRYQELNLNVGLPSYYSPQNPGKIYDVAKNGDPRFRDYIEGLAMPFANSLKGAYRFTDAYIRLCSDPRAKDVDHNCRDIGGHVHIAKITQKEGFRWIDPPGHCFAVS